MLTSQATRRESRTCWCRWFGYAAMLDSQYLVVVVVVVVVRKRADLPVRTNWPTVDEKPDRKALKGWTLASFVLSYFSRLSLMSFSSSRLSTSVSFPYLPVSASVKTYIIAGQHAVRKLQHADRHQKGHKRIQKLRPLRCRLQVVLQQVVKHVLECIGRGRRRRLRLGGRRRGRRLGGRRRRSRSGRSARRSHAASSHCVYM